MTYHDAGARSSASCWPLSATPRPGGPLRVQRRLRGSSPFRPETGGRHYQDDSDLGGRQDGPGHRLGEPCVSNRGSKSGRSRSSSPWSSPTSRSIPCRQALTIFGDPQPRPTASRGRRPQFYEDFLNTPSLLNHFDDQRLLEGGHRSATALELDAYGPYTLTGNQWEYCLRDAGNAGSACPHRLHLQPECPHRGARAVGGRRRLAVVASYDNIIYQQAGQDEALPGRSSAR